MGQLSSNFLLEFYFEENIWRKLMVLRYEGVIHSSMIT